MSRATGISKLEAKKYLPDGFDIDPYFPEEARCGEEHVKHMLSVCWPVLASYRKVLVSQRAMSTYAALGMFMVGDTDLGHLGAGHVWFIDYPGKGKTILAKVPAKVIGGTWSRFQGVPDALPQDYTGNRFIQINEETDKRCFELEKGPGFADIQLIDEANRLNPRTQSALLEAFGEGTITIAGETHTVRPFGLFTTNPVESEGTYTIGDALQDRIAFQIVGEQFSADDFTEILDRTDKFESMEIKQVCDIEKVHEIRKFFHRSIYISPEVRKFIGTICELLNDPDRFGVLDDFKKEVGGHVIETTISGRGAVHLKGAARVLAAFRYRNYVTPDDIYKVLLPMLRHRVIFAKNALPVLKNVWGHKNDLTTRDEIINRMIQGVWK